MVWEPKPMELGLKLNQKPREQKIEQVEHRSRLQLRRIRRLTEIRQSLTSRHRILTELQMRRRPQEN